MAWHRQIIGMPPPISPTITIRPAYADDYDALVRLAALDSSSVPARPVLVADVDGELRVALGLRTGAVIADPFYPTLDLVSLLRAHAKRLDAPEPAARRLVRRPRFRLATG